MTSEVLQALVLFVNHMQRRRASARHVRKGFRSLALAIRQAEHGPRMRFCKFVLCTLVGLRLETNVPVKREQACV